MKDAEADGSLQYIVSTYSPEDNAIYDGLYEGGRKVISFCGVLQQNVFPLPELLQMAMTYGAEAMRRPVEIEFAVNLNSDRTGELYLLQIRPIVDSKQMLDEDLQRLFMTINVSCGAITLWDMACRMMYKMLYM